MQQQHLNSLVKMSLTQYFLSPDKVWEKKGEEFFLGDWNESNKYNVLVNTTDNGVKIWHFWFLSHGLRLQLVFLGPAQEL